MRLKMYGQRFYFGADGADGGGSAGDGSAGQADAPPVFEFKDPKTGMKMVLPEKVGEVNFKGLIGDVIAKSRTDIKRELEEKYKPLLEKVSQYEATIPELQAMIQKIEDEKLTEAERNQKAIEREKSSLTAKITASEEKAGTFERMFKDTIEENALLASFSSRADVYQPDQAFKLLKAEFKVDIVEGEGEGRGKYKVVVHMPGENGTTEELDAKTAVEKWLAMPEHNHFIKSNLQPGAGSSANGGRRDQNGTVYYKASQMQNEKIRAEYNSKLKAGESVQLIPGQ